MLLQQIPKRFFSEGIERLAALKTKLLNGVPALSGQLNALARAVSGLRRHVILRKDRCDVSCLS
jgi:hypothetical protein